jgi:hypothetical protein
MPKRPLAVFLLCLGVVAVSGALAFMAADSWLHEPGAQLFGARPFFLIWIVALLEGPVLAAVSAPSNQAAGFIGTVAGVAAMTLEAELLQYIGTLDLTVLPGSLFVVAGVVAIPVAVEFWIVATLYRRGRGSRKAPG